MDRDDIARLPKVVLHDHLDGGVRPSTVLDLADDVGYRDLPGDDVPSLTEWFHQDGSGSLEEYLSAFVHTVAVMQTAEGLERVAYECLEDLAADGVVYAEIRFAPSLHTERGLNRRHVIEAVLEGMRRGERDHGVAFGVVVDALRHRNDSTLVTDIASEYVGQGVVAFDLSGPEDGFPADRHLAACRLARETGLGLTLHAGEAVGPESMWRAYARCHAQRIGHGFRIVDDAVFEGGDLAALGAFAATIRNHQVPLELCPTSNVHTVSGMTSAAHPIGALHRAGFNVTVNTDNRLMSDTTLTDELWLTVSDHGFDADDLETVTLQALRAGFGDAVVRRQLATDVVMPAFASLRGRTP